MSYASILKTIPEALNQPTGIAAIASLGLHGAIALIVPLMPVDSSQSAETTDATKAVGLMELSAADQSRLPQTIDPSQAALQASQQPLQPQIALPDLSSEVAVIPPLQEPLPTNSVLPPIPRSSANYNLSYLPRQQSVSLPQFSRNNNFRTQVTNFRIKPVLPSRASVSPFVDDIDVKIRETQPLNINRLPQVQASNPGDQLSTEPLINPSADAIDIGSTATSQGVNQPQRTQLGDNPVAITANTPANLRNEISLPGKSNLLSAAPITIPTSEIPAQQQIQVPTVNKSESLVNKQEQLLAKLESYNSLRSTIREQYPNIKEQAAIRETISTNQREMQGIVLGRLVVDPDGKILDIKFQNGSVTPELEAKTRAFFNANPPKAAKQISSYPFQLRFRAGEDGNNTGKTVELKPTFNPNNRTVSDSPEKQNSPQNQAVVIPSSSPTPTANEGQSTESTQNLINQLRQVKQERQTSN
jgi:hypothetical protein